MAAMSPRPSEAGSRIISSQYFPVADATRDRPGASLPVIPSLGFTVALQLARISDGKPMNALIRMPGKIDRFIRLPAEKDAAVRLITLEQATACSSAGCFPAIPSKARRPSASSGIPNLKSRKKRKIWSGCSKPR